MRGKTLTWYLFTRGLYFRGQLTPTPFPTYNQSVADDFKNISANSRKHSINGDIITEKSCQHCGNKDQILVLSNFSFLSQCFQKSTAADASESVYFWKKG